jgi:hypothetical protein
MGAAAQLNIGRIMPARPALKGDRGINESGIFRPLNLV